MKTELYGEEIGGYRILEKIGIWVTVFGFILVAMQMVNIFHFPYSQFLWLFGAMFIFMGVVIWVAGYSGVKEEEKHYGELKIKTWWGRSSFVAGMVALFTMHYWEVSLLLGVLAILLGIKGIKEGDNQYAKDGIAVGVIALALMSLPLVIS